MSAEKEIKKVTTKALEILKEEETQDYRAYCLRFYYGKNS